MRLDTAFHVGMYSLLALYIPRPIPSPTNWAGCTRVRIYLSACPPSPSFLSPSLQVSVYVTLNAVVAYSKVGLVVLLHGRGTDRDSALLLVGVAIQWGSLLGAFLFFCLVYFTPLFNSG